jgi:hypothetical protein
VIAQDAEIALRFFDGPGDPEGSPTTLAEMIAVNSNNDLDGADYFLEEHAPHLRALAVGETYTGNEGAGGTWSARRVA